MNRSRRILATFLLLASSGPCAGRPAAGRDDPKSPPTGFAAQPVDAMTGQPIADFLIQFTRVVPDRPETWQSAMTGRPVVAEGWPAGAGGPPAASLVPGTYRIRARREAQDPAELECEPTMPLPEFEVTAGVVRAVRVPVVRRPQTAAELRDRYGSIAAGIVTDERGRPLAGVEVTVAGAGRMARPDGTATNETLRGGKATTGPDGRYWVRFGGGWIAPDEPAGKPIPCFTVARAGLVELSRTRLRRTAAAIEAPAAGARPPESNRPFVIDFRMTEPATVTLEFDGNDVQSLVPVTIVPDPREWDPARSIFDDLHDTHGAIGPGWGSRGPTARWLLAPGPAWRFGMGSHGVPGFLASPRVVFPGPGEYRVKLRLVLTRPDARTVGARYEFVSVRGPGGEDLMSRVIPDADP